MPLPHLTHLPKWNAHTTLHLTLFQRRNNHGPYRRQNLRHLRPQTRAFAWCSTLLRSEYPVRHRAEYGMAHRCKGPPGRQWRGRRGIG